MIELRYEHFQPETGILLGHVEMHKIHYSLGTRSSLEYLVNFEERENSKDSAEYISKRFSSREDALKEFNSIMTKFHSAVL